MAKKFDGFTCKGSSAERTERRETMKYRCFFIYQSPKYFGPAFSTIDMTLDEKISSQNIKSVETEGKKVIEADQGCKVSNFFIAAWSELIDTEGGVE